MNRRRTPPPSQTSPPSIWCWFPSTNATKSRSISARPRNSRPPTAFGVHPQTRRHTDAWFQQQAARRSVNNTITLFSGTTSAASATSFAQQLAATLEQYLNQSNESAVQINIQLEASQNSDSGSGGGQYLVTATTPEATSNTAS